MRLRAWLLCKFQAIFRVPGSFPRAHILKLREWCREKVEKEQAHAKELKEQQKLRQIEERKAREAALELKRQNEEREEAERLAAEAAQVPPCDDAAEDEPTSDEAPPEEEEPEAGAKGDTNGILDNENQIQKATTVIESYSTESIKQQQQHVANGKQPVCGDDASMTRPTTTSPEPHI